METKEEIKEYMNDILTFIPVSPEETERLIEAKEGNIVLVGRETCPYTRRFVKKLSKISKDNNLTIHYLHSKTEETLEVVNALREKYDIPTVPGLVYSDESNGIKVRCNSMMTPEEIIEFVHASVSE